MTVGVMPSDPTRFVIECEAGRGGAGVVYRAFDQLTERWVALKVIAAEAGFERTEEARLHREGELLSRLDHPGIVRTVAYGVLELTGQPYVAMEWLDGEDLSVRHRREPFNPRDIVRVTIRIGEALAAAHAAGVIHRDVKPSNVLLCRCPPSEEWPLGVIPKLVDFGVATAGCARITRTGDLVGTPAYMAPEQARGDAAIDARADVYSLGATLFELIAGRPPHVGSTAIATLARLVTTRPPRLVELRRDTPPELDELVWQMLSLEPDERPASMQAVVAALRDALPYVPEATGASLPPEMSLSFRLGSSASRLVTSLVALRFPTPAARERAVEQAFERGAEAVRLGADSLVAHLGARKAVGTEAIAALKLGLRLARAGAQVGVASGRARVSLTDQSGQVQPGGEAVDRASHLARQAKPGTLISDASTTELGRDQHDFVACGDGAYLVGEPVRQVRAERADGAPFVGREPELAQMVTAFERCTTDSVPILVTVSGSPGIGKSRLAREALSRILARPEPPFVVLQRSDAYGRGHALGAAADLLRAVVGLPRGATARDAEEAIVARLGPATHSETAMSSRSLLSKLLANEALPEGIDPRGARDALWLAMTELVGQVAHEEPTIIVLEDLQWADAESIGWFDHLLSRSTHQRLLVLALVRPGFWSDNPGRFAGRDHVRIELRPLSPQASRAIAATLLGRQATEEILGRIAEQAGGLPLFAEELARLTASGSDTTHAPTIEAAIQVSLDALDEECRDAVGRLSVLGLTGWDSALAALGMPDAGPLIDALDQAEVLIEQPHSRYPGVREWRFKHALVREVAYSSLGEAERRELHGLAARWLATMGEDAATVARHFDLGGQQPAAAEYWARAAQRALLTNALVDAVTMADRSLGFAEDRQQGFQRALCLDEAWSRLDPRASDRESAISALEENVYDEPSAVRSRGARARYDDARGTGEDITARLGRIRDQARALGLYDEEARCSAALASRLAYAGRFEEAQREASQLLELAQERAEHVAAVDAWQTLAIVRQTQGALTAALEARRNAVRAARTAGLREREAMLTTNLGFALTTMGARQEARGALETGLGLADAIGSAGAVRHAQMNLLGWAATFGNDRQLEGVLAGTREDADAAACGAWTAPDRANLGVLFYRGWELLRTSADGAALRARNLLKLAAETYRVTGNRDVLPVALGVWAEAERRTGNLERALELVREATALLDAGAPSLLNESTVYLVLHDVSLERGDGATARDAVARGLEPLRRRIDGLVGTFYARMFLTEIPHNAGLLAAASTYGLVPDAIRLVLEGEAT
jgi:eukaryotic-like serine/threonine-protein kinase